MKDNVTIVVPLLRKGGGAEKIASWLSRELDEKEYAMRVVTFWDRENEHPIGGVKHVLSAPNVPIVGLIVRAFRLYNFLRKTNTNRTVSFTEEANAVLILSKVFGYNGRVYVSLRNNPLVRGFLSRSFIRYAYRFADRVVVNSRAMAVILEKKFNLKNVQVIHNPCDLDKNNKMSLESLSESFQKKIDGKFVFLHIGRMIDQKGHLFLLNAFADVVKDYPNAVLILIGTGVMEQEIKKHADDVGLANCVFFEGFQDNVYPYIKKADCFVFPSLWEAFPNALLDALSLSKVVISSDCDTGPRELLAPELAFDEHVEYPYFGKYGVLVNTPLRDDEVDHQLSDMMKEAIKTQFNHRFDNSKDSVRLFEPGVVIKQWVDLIGK